MVLTVLQLGVPQRVGRRQLHAVEVLRRRGLLFLQLIVEVLRERPLLQQRGGLVELMEVVRSRVVRSFFASFWLSHKLSLGLALHVDFIVNLSSLGGWALG